MSSTTLGGQTCGFNSRAREGRDATRPSTSPHGRGFNSRAREGRDPHRWADQRQQDGFNSRAREGRDR